MVMGPEEQYRPHNQVHRQSADQVGKLEEQRKKERTNRPKKGPGSRLLAH